MRLNAAMVFEGFFGFVLLFWKCFMCGFRISNFYYFPYYHSSLFVFLRLIIDHSLVKVGLFSSFLFGSTEIRDFKKLILDE